MDLKELRKRIDSMTDYNESRPWKQVRNDIANVRLWAGWLFSTIQNGLGL